MPQPRPDDNVIRLKTGPRRKRKLLEPRTVVGWARAFELAEQSEKQLPAVVRWRNAILGEDGPQSPVTRAILLVLSCHMDKYGQCFPSYGLLAKESKYSRRVLIRHVKLAGAECWLEVTKAPGRSHGWKRNEYVACIPTFKPSDCKSLPKTKSGDSECRGW